MDIGVGDSPGNDQHRSTQADVGRSAAPTSTHRRPDRAARHAARVRGVIPQGDGGAGRSRVDARRASSSRRSSAPPSRPRRRSPSELAKRARERGIGDRRQRRRWRDAYPERLFLGDVRRRIDDGDLCLGRARSRRQPAASHPGPGQGGRARAMAGPPCRPRPCRRSPTARSTNSPQWLSDAHG